MEANTKLRMVYYANNRLTPPPFLGPGTTLKTDVSLWRDISSGCRGVLPNSSHSKKQTSKIARKRMAHILCILALLCFASSVAENTETEQGFKDLQLQQDSLPGLEKLQDNQVRCFYISLTPFFMCSYV